MPHAQGRVAGPSLTGTNWGVSVPLLQVATETAHPPPPPPLLLLLFLPRPTAPLWPASRMGGVPRGVQYGFLSGLTFLLDQSASGKGTEDWRRLGGASPGPHFPQWDSLAHRLRRNRDSLPASIGLRKYCFPKSGWHWRGLPQGGPCSRSSLSGEVPTPSSAFRTPRFFRSLQVLRSLRGCPSGTLSHSLNMFSILQRGTLRLSVKQ